jgi:hypothetical protein
LFLAPPPVLAAQTMPVRRDRTRTPAKQNVSANESVDTSENTFELGTSVTVFWTGEKAWYDGVIDGRRKEGGRRGCSAKDPHALSVHASRPCTSTARQNSP